MRYASPAVVLVLVTALCLAYGHHSWSWLSGPVAAAFVWALDRKAHEPVQPARTLVD